jgi:hypothetical protein
LAIKDAVLHAVEDEYNVTVEGIYRDKDEWKSTGSFECDDFLLLAKAVDQAHTWIFAQPKPEKPEAK